MGLPLSPTLANIFLCYHESNWLENCPKEFKPIFFRRYVDDTFAIFRNPDHVNKFLEYLNKQHPNMKFTHEAEEDSKLPFLDCLVHRTGGQFSTSVHRKKTFSGLGLSFFSFSSFVYKVNSIKTLIFRANAVSTTFTALNKELSFLVNYFSNNGYPKSIVYREIGKFIRKMQSPTIPVHTAAKKVVYASFGYYGKLSENLKIDVTHFIEKLYPHINFRMALVNGFTISSMFPYKDSLPFDLRSSIIYKYSCTHCVSGTYVGSTVRAAYMRFAEHEGISFCTGKPTSVKKQSSIREHCSKCGPFNKSNFAIIGHEKTDTFLRILESMHINSEKPELNDMQSAYPLCIVK